MEERTLITGELKNPIGVCAILPILAVLAYLIDAVITMNSPWVKDLFSTSEAFHYAFGFGNDINIIFIPLFVVLLIVSIILYSRWSKVKITVTDKRVFGNSATGKRVDLPLDSISAVGTSAFSGLAVTTASGAIKFKFLKNRDDIHNTISKLLIERQEKDKNAVTTTIKQEVQQSNADELKKFKELLDNGVITQDEFDVKKKQLLGL